MVHEWRSQKWGFCDGLPQTVCHHEFLSKCELLSLIFNKGVLVIRCTFPLVDMITNIKFSNHPYIFRMDVVRQ